MDLQLQCWLGTSAPRTILPRGPARIVRSGGSRRCTGQETTKKAVPLKLGKKPFDVQSVLKASNPNAVRKKDKNEERLKPVLLNVQILI